MKTDILIQKVRLGMSLPNIENRFSDAALLDLANDEIQSSVLPWLFSLREEYSITSQDFSLSSLATNGYLNYPLFSSGRTLKDIWVTDSNTLDRASFKPLERIGLDRSWIYNNTETNSTYGDFPRAFVLQGDRIYLYPKPTATTTGTLRLYYHVIPNTLVNINRGANISSISGDDTITIGSGVPSFMRSAGVKLDIIFQTPDYQVFIRDQEVSSSTNSTITLVGYDATNTLSGAGFLTGMLVCLAGETTETPLPVEVNQLLIQSIIVRVLESMNAPQQLGLALERFNRLKTQLRQILSPRAENRPITFVPSYSFLRSQVHNRRRF